MAPTSREHRGGDGYAETVITLRTRWLSVVVPLLVVAATSLVFLPLSRPYDLDVFLRAGSAALHGLQVYPSPGSSVVYAGGSFVYPYFAVFPFVALTSVSHDLARLLFFLVCVGAVLAPSLVGAMRDRPPVTLVLCTTFAITGLQLGALSPLLFAGVLFLWRLRDRPGAFASLAAPVVASKLFLAPWLMWLLVTRRYRAFAYASAATLALLALSFALGPIGPVSYLHVLSQLGTHEARAGFGLIGALMNLGLVPSVAQGVALVLVLVLGGVTYGYWRRTGNDRVVFCAGIVASLVLTPVLWSHYLILVVAGLVVLGVRRRWFVILALASWAISPPHGVDLHADVIAGVRSSGVWLAVAACLIGLTVTQPHGSWTRSPLGE